MNGIEKKLVFPKLKVRLKMQEEYKDISRFRQENTVLRKEMNERFKRFTRKMEDEWESMLKETDARTSEEFNRRVENVALDIINTSFYKNNGEVVEGKNREEWDSLRRELLLLSSLGIIGSEGELTSFGKSVQEHIRKSKRANGTN